MEKSNLVFNAVIVKEGEGFSAICIDLDVASDGQTDEQVPKAKDRAGRYLCMTES